MSTRITRGHYKIRKLDGGWREGTVFAGQRIKLAEGEWLEHIACVKPMALMRGSLLLFPVVNVPCVITFRPFELLGPFDVRRYK